MINSVIFFLIRKLIYYLGINKQEMLKDESTDSDDDMLPPEPSPELQKLIDEQNRLRQQQQFSKQSVSHSLENTTDVK
tara:strand:- start:4998 stop:5231 length:234 start_codon:yes stop_codon:yes gene_type:complete